MELVDLFMVRKTYVKPTMAYVVLEDACMRFTSWIAHKDERVLPVVEEGDDGVEIPYGPKGAKAFDGWDFSDDDDDVSYNRENVAFGYKNIK